MGRFLLSLLPLLKPPCPALLPCLLCFTLLNGCVQSPSASPPIKAQRPPSTTTSADPNANTVNPNPYNLKDVVTCAFSDSEGLMWFGTAHDGILTYQGGIRAQIEAVRVHKSQRGKGLGKLMFEWAIARAQERGSHVLQLTTDKRRPEALKFYQDLGFDASHEGMKMHF